MNRVDRHGLPELCEILCRQLDVARQAVLDCASDISVYKREDQSVRD